VTLLQVENPSRWPEPGTLRKIEEPVITAMILTAMRNMSAES
jgi:translation elongation factor EF-4